MLRATAVWFIGTVGNVMIFVKLAYLTFCYTQKKGYLKKTHTPILTRQGITKQYDLLKVVCRVT